MQGSYKYQGMYISVVVVVELFIIKNLKQLCFYNDFQFETKQPRLH